uniref:Uncharacterized protein n=1 Tax=Romanomermis culicivorax TaxID=13658 RepID=A0A915KGW4_ROMCU
MGGTSKDLPEKRSKMPGEPVNPTSTRGNGLNCMRTKRTFWAVRTERIFLYINGHAAVWTVRRCSKILFRTPDLNAEEPLTGLNETVKCRTKESLLDERMGQYLQSMIKVLFIIGKSNNVPESVLVISLGGWTETIPSERHVLIFCFYYLKNGTIYEPIGKRPRRHLAPFIRENFQCHAIGAHFFDRNINVRDNFVETKPFGGGGGEYRKCIQIFSSCKRLVLLILVSQYSSNLVETLQFLCQMFYLSTAMSGLRYQISSPMRHMDKENVLALNSVDKDF